MTWWKKNWRKIRTAGPPHRNGAPRHRSTPYQSHELVPAQPLKGFLPLSDPRRVLLWAAALAAAAAYCIARWRRLRAAEPATRDNAPVPQELPLEHEPL